MFERAESVLGVSAPAGFESRTLLRGYRVRSGDEELLHTRVALALGGEPQAGVFPVGPHRDAHPFDEVENEPQRRGAVAVVDDLDRAPGLRGSAVAAPDPVHRPLARVHRGFGQGVDLVRA
ncbi:hypothetical protein, partial [Nocardia takedensis]|uniref:hypothetical protein n=1 Tax=Nocardia takedensis TaxID=259390 RepID=UPI001C3F2060